MTGFSIDAMLCDQDFCVHHNFTELFAFHYLSLSLKNVNRQPARHNYCVSRTIRLKMTNRNEYAVGIQ